MVTLAWAWLGSRGQAATQSGPGWVTDSFPHVSHPSWMSDLARHMPLVAVSEAQEEKQKRAKLRTAMLTLPKGYWPKQVELRVKI